MREKLTVIIPAVVVHNLDPHTGIPFLPHMAGHVAGMLDYLDYNVQVIDCFGIQPHQRKIINECLDSNNCRFCRHCNYGFWQRFIRVY